MGAGTEEPGGEQGCCRSLEDALVEVLEEWLICTDRSRALSPQSLLPGAAAHRPSLPGKEGAQVSRWWAEPVWAHLSSSEQGPHQTMCPGELRLHQGEILSGMGSTHPWAEREEPRSEVEANN